MKPFIKAFNAAITLDSIEKKWRNYEAENVQFWAVQNLFWAGRCPKLGLNPPVTAQNCPKLPKTAQNCLKLPTDYESAKFWYLDRYQIC